MKTKCYVQGAFKKGTPVEIGTVKALEFPVGGGIGLALIFPGGQSGVKLKEGDTLMISWERKDVDHGVYTVKLRTEA